MVQMTENSKAGKRPKAEGEESDDEDVNPHVCPPNYIPKDPWCIKVRWLKDGMLPPGALLAASAHNSRQDLQNEAGYRNSMVESLGSTAPSTTSMDGQMPVADSACYVYMDVQLYTLEPGSDKQDGTFLVDFKCAGYEAVVEKVMNDTEKMLAGTGLRVANKDVTSPQPFLDLANKLVIHLAGGKN